MHDQVESVQISIQSEVQTLDWTWGNYGIKCTIEQVSAGFWHGAHGSVLDGQILTHTTKESAAPLRALQSKKPLVACGQSANSDLPATCSDASFNLHISVCIRIVMANNTLRSYQVLVWEASQNMACFV